MINEHIENMLLFDDSEIMIRSEDVATVRTENTLLHTMMILSTVGYSSIPVIDNQHYLQGVISLPLIIEGVKNHISYDWDKLSEMKVEDVICHDYSVVNEDADLEDILHQMVDHNFVSVVNEEGKFVGIYTRKNILKRVNFLAHEIDRFYDIKAKKEQFSMSL
ncbi:MAG: CBS domain-containing protein [Clostridiaceae bacterium]|jgi:predicted transcriptional regulator|nr:cyclic-di-AMP-binding protein CbpB [Bacillota bacterium]NLN51909.1 CBS domain-containing protein [Clostridiaceae bacterium]